MAISEETFFLNARFQGTLQQQIQQMVAEGILSGRLRAGEKLPSSRKLASHLGVSRITVTLAYTELVADDYLRSAGRSGYFVSETAPEPPSLPLPERGQDDVDWARAIGQKFSGEAGLERPEDWRKYRFPFIYGQADPTLFDHKTWRLAALRALGRRDFEALTADYYERDDARLVEFIARHILPRRGIVAAPEEILITLGAQNALWLSAQVLLTQRRTALVENPCYPALRSILSQARCNMVACDVDGDGLDPETMPHGDVVFVTPSHQCPTTATMPLARRKTLLARARDEDFLIVEDDYEFEMSFLRAALPALKSLDQSGRVIYVGSLSKSLFPGLRLGYLVGSEPFIREARALRASVLRHPPGHMQRTAAYFLSQGHYDAMVRRMGRAFHDRRDVMERALTEAGLTIAGRGVFGGSSFWMEAPEVDTAQLAEQLRQRGVLIEPGRPFFHGAGPDRFYRLAYSSIPAARIPEGVQLIAEELALN